MKFLPERKKAGTSEKKSRLSAKYYIVCSIVGRCSCDCCGKRSSICSCTLWSCFCSAYESVASSSSANPQAFRITASCSSEKGAALLTNQLGQQNPASRLRSSPCGNDRCEHPAGRSPTPSSLRTAYHSQRLFVLRTKVTSHLFRRSSSNRRNRFAGLRRCFWEIVCVTARSC